MHDSSDNLFKIRLTYSIPHHRNNCSSQIPSGAKKTSLFPRFASLRIYCTELPAMSISLRVSYLIHDRLQMHGEASLFAPSFEDER